MKDFLAVPRKEQAWRQQTNQGRRTDMRRGRKPHPERTKAIMVVMTPAQHYALKLAALQSGVTASDLVRRFIDGLAAGLDMARHAANGGRAGDVR